jgi:hypothetical protein
LNDLAVSETVAFGRLGKLGVYVILQSYFWLAALLVSPKHRLNNVRDANDIVTDGKTAGGKLGVIEDIVDDMKKDVSRLLNDMGKF